MARTIGRIAVIGITSISIWGHEVGPRQLNLVAGGETKTFEIANSGTETNCTTSVTLRVVTAAGTAPISVSPATATYSTPPNFSHTFTVTPLREGDATIFVDWRIVAGNNLSCDGSGSPSVTVRVTAPVGPQPLRYSGGFGGASPPTLAAEGLSELVGDIVLQATGGTPTPAGQAIPATNIQVFLNTSLTSRILSGNLTEALLLVDEPSPTSQRPCLGVCPLVGVGGSGINYANPSASSNGGQGVYNVYQGVLNNPSSLTFLELPLDPPGPATPRVFRITNVRANANQLGVSPTMLPMLTNIRITNAATGQTVPFQFSTLPVRSAGVFSTNSAALQQCVSQSPPTSTESRESFRLRFAEGFASSFKSRNAATQVANPAATAPQNDVRTTYNTQSGFYNPSFPVTNGLYQAGLADHGARLVARFNNIPSGVALFAQSNLAAGALQARATASPEGPFTFPSLAGPAQGILPIPIVNGSALAVWEIVGADPATLETAEFKFWVSYTSNVPSNLPAPGTATVTGGFAPLFIPAASSATAPIPRFVDTREPRSAFSINVCQTNLLYPFVSNSGGFDTGLAIANTSLDPFGPPPRGSRIITNEIGGPLDSLSLNLSAETLSQDAVNAPREATSNWLTVDLDQATTPATAIYQVNPTGLAAGIYRGTISVNSPKASSPLAIPFRLNIAPLGPSFGPYGVGNAGSYAPAAVSPGEAVVIFGKRFGPSALATLALDSSGRVATTLAGTRVFFDNVPAPLIYAVDGQISAFVPFSVAGKSQTVMRVEHNGATSLEVSLPVVDAIPALLTANQSGGGQGAILNQDSSVNTASNAAAVGDIIFLFGTGAGQTDPPGTDGKPAALPLPRLVLSVKAFVDGREAEVLYAGPAPALAEGVLQVNLRIPAGVRRGPDVPIWITVGDKRSQPGVSVAIR